LWADRRRRSLEYPLSKCPVADWLGIGRSIVSLLGTGHLPALNRAASLEAASTVAWASTAALAFESAAVLASTAAWAFASAAVRASTAAWAFASAAVRASTAVWAFASTAVQAQA